MTGTQWPVEIQPASTAQDDRWTGLDLLPMATLLLDRIGIDVAQLLNDTQSQGIGLALARAGLTVGLRLATVACGVEVLR